MVNSIGECYCGRWIQYDSVLMVWKHIELVDCNNPRPFKIYNIADNKI